jgi:glutamine phosphoribosylpyrophosphate amidotransferase
VFLPRIVIWAPIGDVSAIRALRYYGIDMATRAELIGADLTEQEICDFVGADSLHYITLDGLIAATPNERDNLCTACFTGDYPIPVPGEHEQLAQVKFDGLGGFEALTASPDAT